MKKTPDSLPNPLLDSLVRDAVQAWNTSIVESGNDFDRMKSTLTAIMPQLIEAAIKPIDVASAQALSALKKAEMFIENGVEFGFIRLPDLGDPALETLPLIKVAIRALSAETTQGEQLPQDVINLVIAARDVVYGGHIDIAHAVFDVLDKALEAFASSVPWENEPDEEAAPTPEAGR